MKTVLLIEDDSKLSLAIGVRLKAMGYGVAAAADAITAVTQARKTEPDIIIIDLNLPGGDGFMVAERLLKIVQTSLTPIIFMTASKKPGLKERAEKFGTAAFLEKPFSAEQLADAIENSTGSDDLFPDATETNGG